MNYQRAALRIGELLASQNLIDGDQILDDGRKVLFGAYFEGRAAAEIAEMMCVSALAAAIARELEGLTFEAANGVLDRVRLIFWRVRYADQRAASGCDQLPGDKALVH